MAKKENETKKEPTVTPQEVPKAENPTVKPKAEKSIDSDIWGDEE